MNVYSVAFEATGTNEFGDAVTLGGTARTLQSMTVVLSSFGCESGHWYDSTCVTSNNATFPVDLTFTIYENNAGIPGAILAQDTKSFNILYRPSTSDKCTDGKWYSSKDKTCYNGLPQKVTMALTATDPLPAEVIWSVAYNTTSAGYAPLGTQLCSSDSGGCGYDSLNVGAFSFPMAPFVGADFDETSVYIDSSYYTNTFNPEFNSDWTGHRPLGMITAK